jgi:sulfur carrier protein
LHPRRRRLLDEERNVEPNGDGVTVNGDRQALPPSARLADLLRTLDVTPETKGVAVAVNDELVPRGQWESHRLKPRDRIELVRAVQGG